MIEVVLGFVLVFAYGSAHGWSTDEMIAGGLFAGLVLYLLSCAIWDSVPCWWPFCSKKKPVYKAPGQRSRRPYRRRKPCPVCGGKDRIRAGARLWRRN